MAEDIILAICSSWLDFLASKLSSETDCDHLLIAVVVSDARVIYGYFKRGYGGVDDIDYPRRKYDFLGRHR